MEVAPGSRNTLQDPSSPGPGYVFFRIVNIAALIACFACLAQVMSIYSNSNIGTPGQITFLFAVGIIGTVWGILVLVTFLRANNVSYTIAFFDFVGVVLFIVGVALLTGPAIDECAVAKATSNADNGVSDLKDVNQACTLMRAAWGLAIANILFYFLLVIMGAQIATMVADEYKRLGGPVARRTIIEEGYPTQPAVRNVTQTTTAAVPLQPGAVPLQPAMSEKDRHSKRHRSSSKSRERRHKHYSASERDRRRRSSGGARDDYYYPDRRDSRRSSRGY